MKEKRKRLEMDDLIEITSSAHNEAQEKFEEQCQAIVFRVLEKVGNGKFSVTENGRMRVRLFILSMSLEQSHRIEELLRQCGFSYADAGWVGGFLYYRIELGVSK